MVNLKFSPLKSTFGLLVFFLIAVVIIFIGLLKITRPAKTEKIISQSSFLSSPPPAALSESTQSESEEVHSGDGAKTLIKKTAVQGTDIVYTFTVANLENQDRDEKIIFSTALKQNEVITIPSNSWTPDNKYIFLQKTDYIVGYKNFLVFKASGEKFANEEQYLDVGKNFQEKKINYLLKDATGWASPIYLNITTVDQNNKKGPSYWFDIQSQNFWGHR
jgi:hypothetical protein